MNRTFVSLLIAAVIGAWVGATERFLHLVPLAVYPKDDAGARALRELFDAFPVAAAFLGAALVLVLGVRRAALVGAVCLVLGPLLAVIDGVAWITFYAAPIVRRVFDVTLLAFVASLVVKQKEQRLAALLAFLVCRHAAIELGVNAWSGLALGSLWMERPIVTEAACLVCALVAFALIAFALRRTRDAAPPRAASSPYRVAAPRDVEPAPRGGLRGALPFALGAGLFAVLVTSIGGKFSLRFEPMFGAWVLGAGAVATIAGFYRGSPLTAGAPSTLGALAFGFVALCGAQAAGLRSLPGGLISIVADLALIVVVARTAVTDRGGALVVLTAVPAMEAFASMTIHLTVSVGYAVLLALAALASILVPRRIHAKLAA